MQTLMLGKTLAAGEIPVTRQREGGREGGIEREKGREGKRMRVREIERENWL